MNLQEFLALDQEAQVDELEYIISESFDVDWTARVGAERVSDFLKKLSLKPATPFIQG